MVQKGRRITNDEKNNGTRKSWRYKKRGKGDSDFNEDMVISEKAIVKNNNENLSDNNIDYTTLSENSEKEEDYITVYNENKELINSSRHKKEKPDYLSLADKNIRMVDFNGKRKIIRDVKKHPLKTLKSKYELNKEFKDISSTRKLALKYGLNKEDKDITYTRGLVLFDEKIKGDKTGTSYRAFFSLKDSLDSEDTLPKEKVEEYKKALARRGYRLVNKLEKNHVYTKENADILKYCNEHLGNKSSGLEKAATVISLFMIITGMAFWYPSLTGNVVAENSKILTGGGFALFFIGLLGVFIANKR